MPRKKQPTELAYKPAGLTLDQITARQKGLGASDAERIMAGDWLNLWKEKTGRAKPEDLSRNLAVQLGKATEGFNAYWYELMTGRHVNRLPMVVEQTHFHRKYKFMLANIDGLLNIDGRMRLWEGKHTNPFGSKSDAPARYLAQVQHALEVMNLEGCEMSVLFGNSDWKPFSIERDVMYCSMLVEREMEFWEYVQRDKQPPGEAAVTAGEGLELMRQIDMSRDNQWVDAEATWTICRPHRIRFDDAESKLKGMMPADCDFAFGPALCCVRDRAGKLTLRLPTNKDLLRIQQMQEEAEDFKAAIKELDI